MSFSGNKAITDLAWLIDSYILSNINVSVYFFASEIMPITTLKIELKVIFPIGISMLL
ncbi:hypothetical protein [Citrobacter freundii]|uniref:hypothetical protein n=1 Tax=Citrobacter freundii TaxID=546 RepID=UPI003CC7D636